MATPSGLNISRATGEGAAQVFHWDQFNQSVANIYQRDLLNQKAILNEYNKLSMQMGDASKGLRPADMPQFKQNYDKFKEASLMLQSPKIRNNAQQSAYWRDQQSKSYFDNMSLSQQSTDAEKFKHETWQDIAKDPDKYWDYGQLQKINELYDKSPVGDLNKLGLNTAVPWMHPADAYPVQDFDKHVLGAPKQSSRLEAITDPKTGMTKGWFEIQQEHYDKTPAQVARDFAFGVQRIWSAGKDWSKRFDYDKQNQPDVVEKTFQDAQAILDADPKNRGYQLGKGYADYGAANYILDSQPRDVGSKTWKPNPDWQDHLRDQDKKDIENFEMGKLGKEHQYRMGEIQFRKTLSDAGLKFDGQEMYDAALHPNDNYQIESGGKKMALQGYQLLDKRLSELTAKSKGVDYVILNRYNILNKDQRKRILDKLIGYNAKSAKWYDPGTPAQVSVDQKNKFVQDFVNMLKDRSSSDPNLKNIDLNYDDVNSTAVPVIINTEKGNIQPIPLSNYNYDQFISAISQLVNQNKPKSELYDDSEDFNQVTLDRLNQYLHAGQQQ